MEPHFPPSYPKPKRSVDSWQAQTHTPKGMLKDRHITGLNRFPFNNFTYYLTLFSKFFSSFPHGTCSLSVSHQYLALDGIYHPLRAAIPNNSTLWKRIVKTISRNHGAVTLKGASFQKTYSAVNSNHTSTDYNSEDFQSELIPLHSPLLRESLLVSFPPPSNMLKFSGYSWLIRDLGRISQISLRRVSRTDNTSYKYNFDDLRPMETIGNKS